MSDIKSLLSEEVVNLRKEFRKKDEEIACLKDEIDEWKQSHKDRCKDWLYWKDKNERLREENARLRDAVKAAYYEGWQDRESIVATEDRLHFDFEHSEAHAAIRKGGENDRE